MATPKKNDNATRAQIVALREWAGLTDKRIAEIAGCSHTTVSRLYTKARERGWDPLTSPAILTEHVDDAPRSGRPRKAIDETVEAIIDAVSDTFLAPPAVRFGRG